MADSKSLKKAVSSEVKEAKTDANTGNLETVPESQGGPDADNQVPQPPNDLPTGARSHPG